MYNHRFFVFKFSKIRYLYDVTARAKLFFKIHLTVCAPVIKQNTFGTICKISTILLYISTLLNKSYNKTRIINNTWNLLITSDSVLLILKYNIRNCKRSCRCQDFILAKIFSNTKFYIIEIFKDKIQIPQFQFYFLKFF